jgi:hypothetical protein
MTHSTGTGAGVTNLGPRSWGPMTVDKDGYRDYKIVFLVQTDDTDDGPNVVWGSVDPDSPLPNIGDAWNYGNDYDPYALCWPTCSVTKYGPAEQRGYYWLVEYLFTNRPFQRCQDTKIENPLLEPPKVSGSFVNYTRKTHHDRNGGLILSSSLEPIEIERDYNRPTVTVELNVSSNPLATYAAMIDTVNDRELWGLPARCVKLRNVSWTRHYYGVCTAYYTLRYEFDIRYPQYLGQLLGTGTSSLGTEYGGFDLIDVADVGFKHLNGRWVRRWAAEAAGNTPFNMADDVYRWEWMVDETINQSNPSAGDFVRIQDVRGQYSKSPVALKDGVINPDPVGDPQYLPVIELYEESNFYVLGVPALL